MEWIVIDRKEYMRSSYSKYWKNARKDVYGFMEHLNTSAPCWKKKKGDITIIGAGGASRAVIWSFLKENKMNIKLFNRSKDRGLKLIDDMKKLFPESNIIFHSNLSEALNNCSLLVNCTSLGMSGQPKLDINLEQMNNNSIVYDIVYSPLTTDLLRNAQARNLQTVTGIGMLLHQARPAFQAWSGILPDIDDALEAQVLA